MAAPSVAMRKKLQRKFRLRGFTLKVDALEEAAAFLARFPDAEDEALDLLLDELDKEPLKSSILDRDAVRRVVSLLVEAEEAVDAASPSATSVQAALRVVDSFVVPRFHYDPIKKVFYEHTGRLALHGEAGDKAALYRDRYQVLLQRLARDKYFSKPAFESVMTENESCEITSIQSLVGCNGRRWIMGVISQLEERQFYLEDLTGAVPIDLANAISLEPLPCFFVENTVIVAEGELLSSGIFQVNTCGFPPLEDRATSLSLLMGLDFFGGGVIPTEEALRLSSLENKAVNDMFVILSDVWLDSYEFGKLGEMIASRTRLKEHSRFLFIPGPDDAGPSKALPRCALPKYLIEELQKHIPNAIFIVLADKSEQKAFKYTGITCFNPGSFANDSTFAAYRPCTKEVELSALES
ncbi:DNA polymerase epsilon subunit 2 [Triticum urartu]|uniref:DNA polymerase II subunit 2 n=1 Tax=Triticum urartu TaxID=4572 RepID=M7Z205_TRIUA|nr:DNA polymerase epsilon subunit 2 [Triticum urartu]